MSKFVSWRLIAGKVYKLSRDNFGKLRSGKLVLKIFKDENLEDWKLRTMKDWKLSTGNVGKFWSGKVWKRKGEKLAGWKFSGLKIFNVGKWKGKKLSDLIAENFESWVLKSYKVESSKVSKLEKLQSLNVESWEVSKFECWMLWDMKVRKFCSDNFLKLRSGKLVLKIFKGENFESWKLRTVKVWKLSPGNVGKMWSGRVWKWKSERLSRWKFSGLKIFNVCKWKGWRLSDLIAENFESWVLKS